MIGDANGTANCFASAVSRIHSEWLAKRANRLSSEIHCTARRGGVKGRISSKPAVGDGGTTLGKSGPGDAIAGL